MKEGNETARAVPRQRRNGLLAQEKPGQWQDFPWLWLSAAGLFAIPCLWQVLKLTGAPAVPLDDAYIHFQYARALLRGSPFTYTVGAEPAAGATSLLWPVLLAPAYALGLRGIAIIWAAWLFGWLSLGLLARETYLAASKLLSRPLALAAGLATFAFAANAWFATSGMEVVPLAWLLTRSARRAADWIEGEAVSRAELWALAWASATMRPEGALGALLIAAAVALVPRAGRRGFPLLVLFGCAITPLLNFIGTGQATQTTSRVKWLPFNPYYDFSALCNAVLDNLQLFATTLLNGELWSSAFIPEGSCAIALCLLPALAVQGIRKRAFARTSLLLIVGLGMLIPATYDSFLANRLRYLWPFASAWLIGLAALAELIGEAAALVHRELRSVGVSLAYGSIAVLATKLPFAIEDLALSADAITAQQVSLSRWASTALPESALVGVNDTGAIAYFSDHQVFDVVGLTTRGEAKYWVQGPGSRFEHYERLGKAQLPTHFVVYPEWFGLPWLMRPCLAERVIRGRTILGGVRMLACVADYRVLGSGSRPVTLTRSAEPIDVLDVADLESEAAHGYVLLPASQLDNVALAAFGTVDGARKNRRLERFVFALRPGGVIVARLGTDGTARVRVHVGTRELGTLLLTNTWQEVELDVPHDLAAGRYEVTFEASDAEPFTAFHYWSYGTR